MYSGIRSFIKGLLEHSQSETIAKWVDCRLLTSVYVNGKFVIGGKEVSLARGSELLLALHAAAKDKTLSESEGNAIADYLVQINWKFDTLRSGFYLEVLDESDIQKSLTDPSKQDNKTQHNKSGSVVEPELQTDESTVQKDSNIKDEVPVIKKSGRPPSKKQPV